jgi:hypothetical protein
MLLALRLRMPRLLHPWVKSFHDRYNFKQLRHRIGRTGVSGPALSMTILPHIARWDTEISAIHQAQQHRRIVWHRPIVYDVSYRSSCLLLIYYTIPSIRPACYRCHAAGILSMLKCKLPSSCNREKIFRTLFCSADHNQDNPKGWVMILAASGYFRAFIHYIMPMWTALMNMPFLIIWTLGDGCQLHLSVYTRRCYTISCTKYSISGLRL